MQSNHPYILIIYRGKLRIFLTRYESIITKQDYTGTTSVKCSADTSLFFYELEIQIEKKIKENDKKIIMIDSSLL